MDSVRWDALRIAGMENGWLIDPAEVILRDRKHFDSSVHLDLISAVSSEHNSCFSPSSGGCLQQRLLAVDLSSHYPA